MRRAGRTQERSNWMRRCYDMALAGDAAIMFKIEYEDDKGIWHDAYGEDGKLLMNGQPLSGATVAFHSYNEETKRYSYVCDGRTDEAGRFVMTTYYRFDGAPTGEYAVTVVKRSASPWRWICSSATAHTGARSSTIPRRCGCLSPSWMAMAPGPPPTSSTRW